ncbi:MAG: hypothetical protein ABW063_15925 [Caulobacter sp.]
MGRRLPTSISLWRTVLRINMTAGALLAIVMMIALTALQPELPMAMLGLGLAAAGTIHAWISASALHRLHWRWVVACEE